MNLKTFVVEDDNTYSKMVTLRLEQFGFKEIEVYSSGEDCLENMHHKPDLVLLDFSLGGLNGLDILNDIKKSNPRTEVIILTGLLDEKLRKKCKDAGALGYLEKSENSFNQIHEYALGIQKKKQSNRKILISIAVTIVLFLIYYLIY